MTKPTCISQHIGQQTLQEGHCYQFEVSSTKVLELRLHLYTTESVKAGYRYPRNNMCQDYAFDIGIIEADPVLTEMENGKEYGFNALIKALQESTPDIHSATAQQNIVAMFVQFELRSTRIRHLLQDYADKYVIAHLKELKDTPSIKVDFLNIEIASRHTLCKTTTSPNASSAQGS